MIYKTKSSLLKYMLTLSPIVCLLIADQTNAGPKPQRKPVKTLTEASSRQSRPAESERVQALMTRTEMSEAYSSSTSAKQGQQLFEQASRWRGWEGFNWCVFYAFFEHKMSFSEYLMATSAGGSQVINNIAMQLFYNSHVTSVELGMFQVFSALHEYYQQTQLENFTNSYNYVDSNYEILRHFHQAYTHLRTLPSFESLTYTDMTLTQSDITGLLQPFHARFLGSAQFNTIILQNSLISILSVLEGVFGVKIIQPDPQTEHNPPSVSMVMSHIADQSEQLYALSLLIGYSFQGLPLDDGAATMVAETNLHYAVADILWDIWRHTHDTSMMNQLAQLALLVFHINFLQPCHQQQQQSQAAAVSVLSALTTSHQEIDWGIIRSLAENNSRRICSILTKKSCAMLTALSGGGLDLTLMGSELVEASFITKESLNNILITKGVTPTEQASRIYSAVQAQIGADPTKIIPFLTILMNYPPTQTIAQQILREIQNLNQPEGATGYSSFSASAFFHH